MGLKQVIKFFIPGPLLRRIQEKRAKRILLTGGQRDGSTLLKKEYLSGLTDQERWGLLAALRDLEITSNGSDVNYLEIGVCGGGTMRFLKDHTKKSRFSGIDLFEIFEASDDNTHTSGTFKMADVQKSLGDDVELLRGYSGEELKKLQEKERKFDMIFIDANHTYAASKEDFELSQSLIKDGGYMAFHNCSVGIHPDNLYVLDDGGPWKLTQEVRRMPNYSLEIEVDRLRVFKYAPAH